MIYFSSNIKNLRKLYRFTQEDFAQKLNVNRAVIGSYEEGRAVPKLSVLQAIAELFSISVDDLLGKDFANITVKPSKQNTLVHSEIKILPIVVTETNNELITVVPIKAVAGYLSGYSDPEFIESLPHFALPLPELSKERTYRVFQTQGDSMLPVPSGAYIITDYVTDFEDIKASLPYIIITDNDGIVYKRIQKINKNEIELKSDNPDYKTYSVATKTILEIWRALGFISFNFPEPVDDKIEYLTRFVLDMKKEINTLKNK